MEKYNPKEIEPKWSRQGGISLRSTDGSDRYNPDIIEKKWQKFWRENPDNFSAKSDSDKEKAFILDMFPYPSGTGLHVGHVEGYTASDIYSRYQRMNGKNVLHPIGWDAFGLPAENYAIKTGVHPKTTTQEAVETFTRQMNAVGFSYDWSREVNSSDPEYYKWTQWLFLLFYKNGLAYKKKAKVNWCPKCQTVLANEQAENGKCERCESEVIQKDLEQWFFKITDFIEDKGKTSGLLNGLEKIDWPNSTKSLQKNWIGKSEGAQFKMQIENTDKFIEVYTTRIDTVFGMTYAVVAPEHEILKRVQDDIKNLDEVEKYIQESKKKTDLDRMEAKVKTGVEIKGIKVINPFNGEALPLFVADYVLSQYGTGAVMAVPAHDERDFEFAKKYDLPIKNIIDPVFSTTNGVDKFREEEPAFNRDAITAIVKHWEKDEYIILQWKKVDWRTFITGGIEKDQTAEEAARAEILEETGYKNLKLVKEIMRYHSKFYHVPKDRNQFVHMRTFLFELENQEREEISKDEKGNHDIMWIKKEDVEKIVTPESHKYISNFLFKEENAFCGDGILSNSEKYSGLTSEQARGKLIAWLEENNLGKKKINYKLRDWLVSRQRYWGAPIPIIYCEKCGEVAVPEKDLPVVLPDDVDFKPTGESPLKYSKKFQEVKCPKCGGEAKRESDTMDTFVCSSWYYLRYADPKNEKEFASKEMLKYWLPVDLYVGGAEHSVLHLLYARFFTKVLHNLGYLNFDEPFLKLRHQGTILAEDGTKMSKSKGNVVNPDDVVKEFGADSLRIFEMFMGSLEDAKPWQTKGIVGVYRFLEKVYKLQTKISDQGTGDSKLNNLIHKTIKKVGKDIEEMKFNTAISQLMILANALDKEKEISLIHYTLYLLLLSPFAPHLSEELWNKLGNHRQGGTSKNSIFKEKWPAYDPEMIKDEEIELIIQINGKVRDKITVSADISEEEAKKIALEREKVKNHIAEKEIKKVIFVKGRLINIVISS